MKSSALRRDEETNAVETVHSFFQKQRDTSTGAAFYRVIKLLSEGLGQDARIRADTLTDLELLYEVYTQILANVSTIKSKRHEALLQGAKRFYEALDKAGGVYSVKEVAEILGITENGVRKKRERKQLLAVDFGQRALYPTWQFVDGNKVIPGLEKVLNALNSVSQVLQVQFLLGTDEEYEISRIEYLQQYGADQNLLQKARQLGHQGAR